MIRHASLQPLSRQHHQGLLAALLLKKGVARQVDNTILAAFIEYLWKTELKSHFEEEEQWLVPLSVKPALKALAERMLAEHVQLRQLVAEAAEPNFTLEQTQSFATLLDSHIRFEERIYFPALEAGLPTAELSALSNVLQDKAESSCLSFPQKFWE